MRRLILGMFLMTLGSCSFLCIHLFCVSEMKNLSGWRTDYGPYWQTVINTYNMTLWIASILCAILGVLIILSNEHTLRKSKQQIVLNDEMSEDSQND